MLLCVALRLGSAFQGLAPVRRGPQLQRRGAHEGRSVVVCGVEDRVRRPLRRLPSPLSAAPVTAVVEEMPVPMRRLVIQALILTSLVIQSAGVSLLTRKACLSSAVPGEAVSFLQELAKFPLAIVFLVVSGNGKRVVPVFRRIVERPRELAALAVPSLCFAAQNVLFFVAHQRIPATCYLVLSQTKSIFTAIFSVLLLPGKRLRPLQWLSQPVLAAGAVLVLLPQISAATSGVGPGASDVPTFLVGVAAAVGSAICSGFANVYFERIVKSDDMAFWPRQLQLATTTALMTAPALIPIGGPLAAFALAKDFPAAVWAIVALKAIGGILIGATITFTSSITKNFASAVAIGLTASFAGAACSSIFQLGIVCVFLSMALFNIKSLDPLFNFFSQNKNSQNKDKIAP